MSWGVSRPVMARGRTSRAFSKSRRRFARRGDVFAIGAATIRVPRRPSQGQLAASLETVHSIVSMVLSTTLRADFPPLTPTGPRPSTFEQLAALPDECIDLGVGAALIARDAYGSLDVDALVSRLDALAEPLRDRNLALLAPEEQADEISGYLYGTLDFRGNELMTAPVGRYDHSAASFRDSSVKYRNRLVELDFVEHSRRFRSVVKNRQRTC